MDVYRPVFWAAAWARGMRYWMVEPEFASAAEQRAFYESADGMRMPVQEVLSVLRQIGVARA